MVAELESRGLGARKVQYRLRDWLFSRQRYWGEPFPIVYVGDEARTLDASDLPIELPAVDAYKPTDDGAVPLARAGENWLFVELADGTVARRETNTMPQWAGSCWYYLRFMDPKNDTAPFSTELEHYFMPVDLYIGGVEHAVLHLLYARFWHKVLFDCGLVSGNEPFQRLFNQGMILAQSFRDAQGKYYSPDDVEAKDKDFVLKSSGALLEVQVEKMSKSKLNVVSPDEVIDRYGADAMRLYELFMGPLEQIKMWQTHGVDGVYRFLARIWRLVIDDYTGHVNSSVVDKSPESSRLNPLLHKTIKKVAVDIEALRFNTAISQMMIFMNEAVGEPEIPRKIVEDFLVILSPFAPHVCEELWQRLGHKDLIAHAAWPKHDEALCAENTVKIVLQVNGKRRDEIEVDKDSDQATLEKRALENENVVKFIEGKSVARVIVVPNRLVNVVVK